MSRKKKDLPCILSSNNLCLNDGLCVNDYLGGYTCTCPDGYTGKNCETRIKKSFTPKF